MRDEMAVLMKFEHDNVVKHIESYEDSLYMFIVMEALPNSCDLQSIYLHKLKSWDYHSPLFDETTVRCIIKSIFDGLSHIHSMGVTHRDLKPENILIDNDKKALKIIDFGLAKETSSALEKNGSFEYLAPEIFYTNGNPDAYAPPVDVWAAGLICYQLIAGYNLMHYENP